MRLKWIIAQPYLNENKRFLKGVINLFCVDNVDKVD